MALGSAKALPLSIFRAVRTPSRALPILSRHCRMVINSTTDVHPGA
jgi:hypothetical protein